MEDLMFSAAIICIFGIFIVLLSIFLLIVSLFMKQDSKRKLVNIALKLILFGLIIGMIGFGACLNMFTSFY